MRRFIAVAIVLASALGWPAHAEVLIGAAGALTGQLAWTGSQIQRGAEMAVADINAAGGGKRLTTDAASTDGATVDLVRVERRRIRAAAIVNADLRIAKSMSANFPLLN